MSTDAVLRLVGRPSILAQLLVSKLRPAIRVIVILAAGNSLAEAAEDAGWRFSFSPYIWAARLKGDVATLPPAGPVEVDVSFGDILEDLDLALMGIGQARKGRIGIWGDVFYAKLSADGDTRGRFFSDANYDQTLSFLTLGGSYRLLEQASFSVDALGGVRYSHLDNKLKLKAGLLPQATRYERESWLDPIVGLTVRTNVGPHWYVSGWAMSAVAGESDSAYDLFGGLGYAFNDTHSLILGYRHMRVDYDNGPFLYDVKLYGPMAGFTFRW